MKRIESAEKTVQGAPHTGNGAAEPLREHVRASVERYFAALNGHDCAGLYDLVLAEVELPMLETVLEHTGGNQTRAARMLGINRGTLRRKLEKYGLDE